ncbi:hypothetical protein [Candidatus Symbiopectobacterium sp. NZEC127]|uniref:hypothetical protein n=1 Tax=Candidatus Symbiopectobacterium sp. NZEC127 TaxID=2820472 RepID=UPI002226CC3D|nr:hypothetical protein [Candidatus Symbiopectobacterium sp. NZEC127]
MMSELLFESDEQRFIRCYEHARGYHRRALLLAPQSSSVSLVFNVASLAVECYLIALCALHNIMPMNHNYRSLLTSASEKVTFTSALREDIAALDALFGICSIDDYYHGMPDEQDKARMLSVCEALDALIVAEQKRLPALGHLRENRG